MSIERFGIRISPLAGFAEGYGAELTQLGYAPASVRLQLKVLADLSDWLLSQGMAAADLRRSELDPASSSGRRQHQICIDQGGAPRA
jgi:hypothetical protein